uniref:Replication protein A C-terminal domain-containing protein n=1 Tax=Tetraodon nigroviridis TaxID=99883 RepID=H3C0I6_TETNG
CCGPGFSLSFGPGPGAGAGRGVPLSGLLSSSGGFGTPPPPREEDMSTRRAAKLLPVTVSQLLSAPQGQHQVFLMGYLERTQVSVVGTVRRATPYRTNLQYLLDDMTGPPLLVKQWVSAEATPVSAGTYVKVSGYLRLYKGQRFLLALNIRCIRDLNEITSHMMEVVQAHLQLFGQAFDVNMNAAAAGPSAAGVFPNGLTSLQAQVIGMFAASRDGVSLHKLKTQLPSVSLSHLRSAVAFLLSEGLVYSTVDKHHFKSAE